MTYATRDYTVTTWGEDEQGRQRWRAHADDVIVEFTEPDVLLNADGFLDIAVLFGLTKTALEAARSALRSVDVTLEHGGDTWTNRTDAPLHVGRVLVGDPVELSVPLDSVVGPGDLVSIRAGAEVTS